MGSMILLLSFFLRAYEIIGSDVKEDSSFNEYVDRDILKNVLFVVHIPHRIGFGNVFKAFVSALSIHSRTKIERTSNEMGNFETILDKKYIFNRQNDTKYKIEKFFCWRWLILKTEERFQKNLPNEYSEEKNIRSFSNSILFNLFSDDVRIDSFYERQLIDDHVYWRITRTLSTITFLQPIEKEVDKFKFNFENTLAISVRTWTAPHERDVKRNYSFEIYSEAIEQTLLDNPNINLVIMSFDNDNAIPR
jgi:hypothetical protein